MRVAAERKRGISPIRPLAEAFFRLDLTEIWRLCLDVSGTELGGQVFAAYSQLLKGTC